MYILVVLDFKLIANIGEDELLEIVKLLDLLLCKQDTRHGTAGVFSKFDSNYQRPLFSSAAEIYILCICPAINDYQTSCQARQKNQLQAITWLHLPINHFEK